MLRINLYYVLWYQNNWIMSVATAGQCIIILIHYPSPDRFVSRSLVVWWLIIWNILLTVLYNRTTKTVEICDLWVVSLKSNSLLNAVNTGRWHLQWPGTISSLMRPYLVYLSFWFTSTNPVKMACDDDNDFIRGIFCPHVAVLCSEKAQEMCRKNNLSFSDLLNPFARLTDGKY